jgi:hypothetical protein
MSKGNRPHQDANCFHGADNSLLKYVKPGFGRPAAIVRSRISERFSVNISTTNCPLWRSTTFKTVENPLLKHWQIMMKQTGTKSTTAFEIH